MKKVQEVTYKVISFCDIPSEYTKNNSTFDGLPPDSYITYVINDVEPEPLDIWIKENYPELIGSMFLIDMDY